MNTFKKNIVEIAEEVINASGFLFIECVLRGDNRNRIIEIYMDGENGVTIEDCAKVSRQIADIIENKELITSKYRLDVSSPGVDRPLKFIQQYQKNINRKFEITYKNEDGSQNKLNNAKLIRINNDILIFEADKNQIEVNFNNIEQAKVLISF